MAVTCSLCGHCWHRPPPMLTWHLWNPTQAKYTCQHWRAAISTMTPAWWLSETASWWPRETAAYMLILSESFCVCSEIHKSKAQMTHKIKTGILKKLLDTIREKTMVEKNVSPDCWRRGLRPWIWWSACFDLLVIAKRPWRLKFWQGEASDDSNSNQRDIPACSIWPDCSTGQGASENP